MKKFFSAIAICLAAATATFISQSCDTENYTIAYNVTVTGDADGDVNVTFPNGVLGVNGTAGLNFAMSNDTTALKIAEAIPYETALQANDDKLQEAAANIDSMFNAAAAAGTYAVKIKGYVKEPITGVTLSVDREFTNR